MHITKKSNHLFHTFVSLALLMSSVLTIIGSMPTRALSLGDVVSELPLVGNNINETQTEPAPVETLPIQQQPQEQAPTLVMSPLTPTLSPITSPTQPVQQVIPPIQTPAPLPSPISSVIKPVTPPKAPVVTPPTSSIPSPSQTPTSTTPAPEMNVHTETAATRIVADTPAPVNAVTRVPIDTSAQARQLAAAQSNQGNFFARYMSSKITDAERNQLYVFSAVIVLAGAVLYLYSVRTGRMAAFPNKLQKPLTLSNKSYQES